MLVVLDESLLAVMAEKGRELGYPECCIQYFIAINREQCDALVEFDCDGTRECFDRFRAMIESFRNRKKSHPEDGRVMCPKCEGELVGV